jgi:hypothetical protein
MLRRPAVGFAGRVDIVEIQNGDARALRRARAFGLRRSWRQGAKTHDHRQQKDDQRNSFGFAGNGSSRSALPPSLILIFRAFSKLRCSGVCYCCFGAAGGLAAGAVSPGVVFLVLVLVLAFFLGVVGSAAGA